MTPGQWPALVAHRTAKFDSKSVVQPQGSTAEDSGSASISCDTDIDTETHTTNANDGNFLTLLFGHAF